MRAINTVLVDTTVYRRACIAHPAAIQRTVFWGSVKVTVPVAGVEAEGPREQTERWLQDQVEAIPTVARLAAEGTLRFFTYNEIGFEMFKGRDERSRKGDLFKDILIEKIPAAIERSKFQQMDVFSYIEKAELIKFCKLLLSLDYESIFSHPEFFSYFTEFEKNNLRSLDRFKSICRKVASEKHFPDAFHFWTAETNGLDYFLTADKRFINALTAGNRLPLRTIPIAPTDLVTQLGIAELDPMPFVPGKFYYLV
ncbi:MAG: hypothetical protein ACREQP_22200 [Candidatus Binatia bacterium]